MEILHNEIKLHFEKRFDQFLKTSKENKTKYLDYLNNVEKHLSFIKDKKLKLLKAERQI